MPNIEPESVQVAVAIIRNTSGEVLVSRRKKNTHLAGLWEFPGGKVEAGETVYHALVREIHEELDVTIEHARRLIRITHQYKTKTVILDVWLVLKMIDSPVGNEGQAIDWVPANQLGQLKMPAADVPIINAITLPSCYAITPEIATSKQHFLQQISKLIDQGIKLIQFRVKKLAADSFKETARTFVDLCTANSVTPIVNTDIKTAMQIGSGVHLTSQRLRDCVRRGFNHIADEYLLGVSCHNPEELKMAADINANFAVLSPVCTTSSHPESKPLGWQGFAAAVNDANLPVYALGGVGPQNLQTGYDHGGQGVAGISAFFPS